MIILLSYFLSDPGEYRVLTEQCPFAADLSAAVSALPVFVSVQGQSSDLCPVFSQLPVADHGQHTDDVDDTVLRAHPDLILVNSQDAVLQTETLFR